MRLSHEQLSTQLKQPLRAGYVIASAEPLLGQEAADAVRAAARAQGYTERLIFDVESGFDWNDWRMQTRSLGLFATRRLIEVRLAAAKLSQEALDTLGEQLREPGDDVLLILVPDHNRKLEESAWMRSLTEHAVLIAIAQLRASDFPAWLRERTQRAGLRLDAEALKLLGARVEGNLLAAQQEVDKLALLAGGQSLSDEQVAELVADSARFGVFALMDAALLGQALRLRRVLAGLRGEGQNAVELAPYLMSQLLLLARIAEAPPAQRAGLYARNGVWEARQRLFQEALRRAPAAEWQQRALECARLDAVLKGRANGDPWLELERWLLRIALPPAQSRRFAA